MSVNLNDLLKGLEAETQIEKKASDTEVVKPAVSQELASILEKKASEDVTARAFAEGQALAKALLEKMAAEMPAVNNIQADNAAMVADDNEKILPNPQGTVEQVLEGVVDNAKASGASSDDRIDGEGPHANNVDPAFLKAANENTETKEEKTMDKIASDSELAKFIMEKIAQEFSSEVTTPAAATNTAAAAAPNKIQRDNAVMTAQDDAKVQGAGVVPGGDGTVNALFETIVAKAKAQGGQSDDLINGPGTVATGVQSVVVGGPGPASEGQEKAAAVTALCDAGMDFDMAVDLVKQAEEELLAESWEQEKRACFDKLVNEAGVDFDTAIALIKQAEEDLIKQAEAE